MTDQFDAEDLRNILKVIQTLDNLIENTPDLASQLGRVEIFSRDAVLPTLVGHAVHIDNHYVFQPIVPVPILPPVAVHTNNAFSGHGHGVR